MSDLDEAVHFAKKAVEATPLHHPDWPVHMSTLGNQVGARFDAAGAPDDLEESVKTLRRACEVMADDNQGRRTAILDNLAMQLRQKYASAGDVTALDEAIRLSRQVIASTPEGDAKRTDRLGNLSIVIGDRYQQSGAILDIEEAIYISQQCIGATPRYHPDYPIQPHNLSILLNYKSTRTEAMVDIDATINTVKQAVRAIPKTHINYATILDNLATQLGHKYQKSQRQADLDEAIETARKVNQSVANDHPNRPRHLHNLSKHLAERYGRTKKLHDLNEAIKVAEEAVCALQHEGVHSVAKTSIDLISSSTPLSLQHADKQNIVLHHASRISSDVAAISLHFSKRPAEAIELLEIGRGIIFGALQDLRTDFPLLQEQHPELASSLSQLRRQLDTPTSHFDAFLKGNPASGKLGFEADRRREAAEKLQSLIREIHMQPGFDRFLRATTEIEMLEAAVQGPIVILNESVHRCDAFLIESNGIRVVELPGVTLELIWAQAPQSLETLEWLWDLIGMIGLVFGGFQRVRWRGSLFMLQDTI
ncbi:hypothetical protein B0I35DRAFT_414622 [Stachybotrys elegans]|uniref:Uncharacterized protein n=1 Tax=Stachybotrys elegans TaxID=80388 RepID=A0A8K0SEX3_9HYPO|nr:hypothetical protein B0I35DRAFT_414622 [Stachybotrys elegans]